MVQSPPNDSDKFKQAQYDKLDLRKLNSDAHRYADTDSERDSLHHTLGSRPTQAAPGNHSHNDLITGIATLQTDITGEMRAWKFGRVVTVHIALMNNVAWPANTLVATLPPEYTSYNATFNYYFDCIDYGGGLMSAYIQQGTAELKFTLAKAISTGILGTVTYMSLS